MDIGGGTFTGAHGADYGGGAGNDIAACPDAGLDGLTGILISHHCSLGGGIQTFGSSRDKGVGRGALGYYYHIYINNKLAALSGNRAPPSTVIWLAQFHLIALHTNNPVLLITDKPLGIS